MFALKSGNKFLNVKIFLGKVIDVSLSAKPYVPQDFRSRSEVAKLAKMAEVYLAQMMSIHQNVMNSTKHSQIKNQREIQRLEANIEAMMDKPYREVHTKIKVAERRLSKLRANNDSRDSTAYHTGTVNRFAKILQTGIEVVEVTLTAKAA